MRYCLLLFLTVFFVSCADTAHLRRVVHQGPEFLVDLDQVPIATSPGFPPPYDHPFRISPETLQDVLQSLKVVPGGGFLKMIFSGKEKEQSVFDSKDIALISSQLSKALSEAEPSEHVHFYYSLPRSASKVLVSSGALVLKDKRLHFYLKYYRLPMKKGKPMRTAEQGIPRSEKGKYSFTLREDEWRQYRRYKNSFGFEGSDEHWLVIDYEGIASASVLSADPEPGSDAKNPLKTKPVKTIEERLRMLKRFKEEGLITEGEYRKKKASLLKAF